MIYFSLGLLILAAVFYVYAMEANRKAIERGKENLKQLEKLKTTREEAIRYMNDGFKSEGKAIEMYERVARIERKAKQ